MKRFLTVMALGSLATITVQKVISEDINFDRTMRKFAKSNHKAMRWIKRNI